MRSKKTIYNISSSLVLQFIGIIYGFIVPKLIISSFGSSVNGLVSSITQFLGYIALLESGFGPVLKSVLYKPIANKDKKTIENILKTSEIFFRKIALIFIVYIIALSLLYPSIVSAEFSYIYTISLILILSISTFCEYFFGITYSLYIQSEQETYIISLIQIVLYILTTILIILLLKLGFGIHIIKLATCITFILKPIILNIYVKKKYNLNLKNADKNYKIENKWDGLAQHLAAVIHDNTDIAILTFFCNLMEVSVYAVYYLVIKGIKSITRSFSNGIDAVFGDMLAKNEIDNLQKKFDMYEIFYLTIITILFTCTMVLITPFISIYTYGINDVNYVRYAFGYLLVISEYMWAIRAPYGTVTHAAGHFKETRIGAWVECISNIVISLILVKSFGIIGVTIGTIIAMSIRTFEFMYHANKYLLNRSIFKSVKKFLICVFETMIIMYICKYIPYLSNINYINWVINAILTGLISLVIVILINTIMYKDFWKIMLYFKKSN